MQPPIKLDDLFPKKIHGSCQFHFSKGWEIVRQNITKNGMLFHIFSTRFLTKFLDRRHSFYIRDFFRLSLQLLEWFYDFVKWRKKNCQLLRKPRESLLFVLFAATRLTNPLRVFLFHLLKGFSCPFANTKDDRIKDIRQTKPKRNAYTQNTTTTTTVMKDVRIQIFVLSFATRIFNSNFPNDLSNLDKITKWDSNTKSTKYTTKI